MRSINIDKYVPNRCYKPDKRGLAKPEDMATSAAFFHTPGLMHVVVQDVPKQLKVVKLWNEDLIRVYKPDQRPQYVCRTVVWEGLGWFILSMRESIYLSMSMYVIQSDFQLSTRSFALPATEGNVIMFPFHSLQFRMMRPVPLLLINW